MIKVPCPSYGLHDGPLLADHAAPFVAACLLARMRESLAREAIAMVERARAAQQADTERIVRHG